MGRIASAVFAFDSSYQLHDIRHQRISSIIYVPSFGRYGSVPAWPAFGFQNRQSIRWIENRKRIFAQWILAVLIPHPKSGFDWINSGYGNSMLDCFYRILRQLEEGRFLMAANGDYHGPPGYNYTLSNPASIEPTNPSYQNILHNYNARKFSQMSLARFIGELARGIRIHNKDAANLAF